MHITGTYITYLHLCHRKLWLSANGIRMENATNNIYVEEGKLISETTYDRRAQKWKELDLGNVKIDHYDPTTNTIREVKKSHKLEHVHIAQVKYYIYQMELHGVIGAKALIEYPKQKRTTKVQLSDADRADILEWEKEVARITELNNCPELVKKSYCRSCAYFEFCFV